MWSSRETPSGSATPGYFSGLPTATCRSTGRAGSSRWVTASSSVTVGRRRCTRSVRIWPLASRRATSRRPATGSQRAEGQATGSGTGVGVPRWRIAEPARLPCSPDSLDAADDLTVQDGEPPVVRRAPVPPSGGQGLQLLLVAEAGGDALMREGRLGDPLRPDGAPPFPLLLRRVAPDRRRACDVPEAGRVCPGDQPATGIGLGTVVVGDLVVQLEPPIEPWICRIPGHRRVIRVPGRHHATRPAHPAHLLQRGHRIGEV